MLPIEPTGASPTCASGASSLTPASSGTPAGVESASNSLSKSSVTSISTTTSSMTMMTQQVGGFLGSVDPRLANHDYLKMLIAAMIMSVLLEDGGNQQSGQSALKALESLTRSQNNALFMSIETATSSVQIEHYTSKLDTVQAVQSTWQAGLEESEGGRQMDISA